MATTSINSFSNSKGEKMNFYSYEANDIDGNLVKMEQFKEKVVLIVNTASKCGFTSQFKQLEELYKKYKDRGLVILGFPCNQFMRQDPGSNKEIKSFCKLNYGVSFLMFSKIKVNGDDAHPLYKFLKAKRPGVLGSELIKWNFTKFLIDKKGKVIERFSPSTIGEEIEKAIIPLL
jgi:glutathione peroxidase